MLKLILIVLFCSVCIDGLKLHLKRSIIALAASTSVNLMNLSPVLAETRESNLEELIKQLDDNNVSKVIFRGITPTSATVYLKNAADELEVSLPYDDPKSPSGPAQVIARVQHQPGVVCQQDIGDILKTTKKNNVGGLQRPMFLSGQSPYPTKSDTPVKL